MSATPSGAWSNTAGTNATKSAAGTAGNANAGQQEAATQGPDKMQELLEGFKKQADGQSAVINRLQKELKELRGRLETTPEHEADGDDDAAPEQDGKKKYRSPYMQQLQELREFKAKLEQERSENLQESLIHALINGMASRGVEKTIATLSAEALRGRIGKRVASEKDTIGRSVLVVKGAADNEASASVDDYLDAYLSSDEGKALLPSHPTPSLRGLPIRRGSSAEVSGKVKITKEDLRTGSYDPKLLAEGRYSIQE